MPTMPILGDNTMKVTCITNLQENKTGWQNTSYLSIKLYSITTTNNIRYIQIAIQSNMDDSIVRAKLNNSFGNGISR